MSVHRNQWGITSIASIALAVMVCATANAETVDVKYRGPIDLNGAVLHLHEYGEQLCQSSLLRQGKIVHAHLVEHHLVSLLRDRCGDGCCADKRRVGGPFLQREHQGHREGRLV